MSLAEQIAALQSVLDDLSHRVKHARALLAELKATIGSPDPIQPVPGPDPTPDPTPIDPLPVEPPPVVAPPGTAVVGGPFPAPLRVIEIPDADALRRALANDGPMGSLQAGDRLKCAAFTTGDPVVLASNAGTLANPIVIEGVPGTRFVGRVELKGKWGALLRVAGGGDGFAIKVAGQGARVSRCTLTNTRNDVIEFLDLSYPQASVDYCLFQDFTGPALSGSARQPDKCRGVRVIGNRFVRHRVLGSAEHVICFLLNSFVDHDLLIEGNRFENCMGGAVNQREMACAKTRGTTFRDNTVLACNNGYLSLRSTQDCLVERNWLQDGSSIMVHGRGHVIRHNRSDDVVVQINAGNVYFGTETNLGDPRCREASEWRSGCKWGLTPSIVKGGVCKGAHGAAEDCRVIGNQGRILVGRYFNERGMPVKGIVLSGNSKPFEALQGPGCHVGTAETMAADAAAISARMLSVAEVGPTAPWRNTE